MWTADRLSNTISCISIEGSKFKQSYEIGWEPIDIAYNSEDIIVCLKKDKQLAIFNITNNRVSYRITVGNDTNYPIKMCCVSEKVVWVLGSLDIFQLVDIANKKVLKTINISKLLTRSPPFYGIDGGGLYCSNQGNPIPKSTPIGIVTNFVDVFIGDTSYNPAVHIYNKSTLSYIYSVCIVGYPYLSSIFVDNFYPYTFASGNSKKFSVFNFNTKKQVIEYQFPNE